VCVFNRRFSRGEASNNNFLFFLGSFLSLSLSFERRSATRFYHLKRRKSTRRRKRARISPLVDTRNTETLKIRANAHRKIPSERVRAKKSFKIGSRICVPFDRERETFKWKKNALTAEREREMSSFISFSLSHCLSARDKKTRVYLTWHLSNTD